MLRLSAVLVAALLLVTPATPVQAEPRPQVLAAWVQLTGQGAEARTVVAAGPCPEASADFPPVCSLALPARTASRATVANGHALASLQAWIAAPSTRQPVSPMTTILRTDLPGRARA